MTDRQTKTAVQTAAEDSRATEQQHKPIFSDLLRILHEEEMYSNGRLLLIRPFDEITTDEALEIIFKCYPEMKSNPYSYDNDVIVFELETVPALLKDFCNEIWKHFAAAIDSITIDLNIYHYCRYGDKGDKYKGTI